MPTSRRRFSVLVAAWLGAGATPLASATSVLEFDQWMQRIERRALGFQRNLQRANGAAAAADAKEIEALYRLMEDYFVKQGDAAEAVEISRRGRVLAARLAEHSAAGNFDDARAGIRSLMRDCRACHLEYKPFG